MSTPAAVTRNPLAASATKGHWWCRCQALSSIGSGNLIGYQSGDPDWKDALQSSKSPVAEVLVTLDSDGSAQAGTNTTDVMGRIAGKLKHTRYITGQGSSAVFGDSYKMGGNLWVADKVGAQSVMLWDTGVPE